MFRLGPIVAAVAVAAFAREPCQIGANEFDARAFSAAQPALWECIAAGTTDDSHAWKLTQTYRELRNYAQGIARARQELARASTVDLLYVAAYLEFRTGNHQESIRLLGGAFRKNERDWRVHQLFGLNYAALDIREGARHELQTAAALRPKDPELHYQLARVEFTDQRYRESIAASERALALNPAYAQALNNLGLCYQNLSERAKAETHYRRAIELAREQRLGDEWLFLNYALMLASGANPAAALPLLDEAVQTNPDSAAARFHRGNFLRKLGRDSAALPDLELACKLDPHDPEPHYVLGSLLLRSGDTARGKALLARFEELRGQRRARQTHPVK